MANAYLLLARLCKMQIELTCPRNEMNADVACSTTVSAASVLLLAASTMTHGAVTPHHLELQCHLWSL